MPLVPVVMYCEDTDVWLERVLVHFEAKHLALWKIDSTHPNQSRSHCLALGTRTRTDTHISDILAPLAETETRLHGQWLVWACCDATDVCLVRALVSPASPWGFVGFDVIGVAPKISPRCVARGCNQRIKTRNVDLECFSITRPSIHATGKCSVYLGIRFQNVLWNAMKST